MFKLWIHVLSKHTDLREVCCPWLVRVSSHSIALSEGRGTGGVGMAQFYLKTFSSGNPTGTGLASEHTLFGLRWPLHNRVFGCGGISGISAHQPKTTPLILGMQFLTRSAGYLKAEAKSDTSEESESLEKPYSDTEQLRDTEGLKVAVEDAAGNDGAQLTSRSRESASELPVSSQDRPCST